MFSTHANGSGASNSGTNGNGPSGGTNPSQLSQRATAANNTPGSYQGLPLHIPAGAPRPAFNQGLWEEQPDGSLKQITGYRGNPLKTDRVCHNANCGATRSREWRRIDGDWHCSSCGNYWNLNKRHRVPKPDSHIIVPRNRATKAAQSEKLFHALQQSYRDRRPQAQAQAQAQQSPAAAPDDRPDMEEDAARVSDGDVTMTGDEENCEIVEEGGMEHVVDDSLPLDPALFDS